MQRRLAIFSIIVLCTVFFWKDILSIVVQSTMRYQTGCQMAYRAIHIQDGKIVLDDVVLLDSSNEKSAYHIRAEQICIDINLFHYPVPVHLEFIHPHVTVLQGIESRLNRQNSSRWIRPTISAVGGTFEWQCGLKTPLQGQFSFDENKMLSIHANGGSLVAQWIQTGLIDCSFERWNITSLIQRFTSWEGHGFLSGTLQIGFNQQVLKNATGHLRLENCDLLTPQEIQIGAACMEWEGSLSFEPIEAQNYLETILSFPDRMKIHWKDAFIARGESRLEQLNGTFSLNSGVGPRWEISNASFSWEGKGFSKSRKSNWLESHWHLNEAQGKLSAEQLNGSRCKWTIELDNADQRMIHLFQDLVPIDWPCQVKDGNLNGQFSWEEDKGEIQEWTLQNLRADHLDIQASKGSFQCEKMAGSIRCNGTDRATFCSSLFIENGAGEWEKIKGSALNIHCQINDGQIIEGSIVGHLCNLACESTIKGSLGKLCASLHAKGPWSQYWFWHSSDVAETIVESDWILEGDWNAFSAQVHSDFSDQASICGQAQIHREGNQWWIDDANLEAKHLNLIHLHPLIHAELSGYADLKLNYSLGELSIEGVSPQFGISKDAFALSVQEAGSAEPFTAGVRAFWDRKSAEWVIQTTPLIGKLNLRGCSIPFEGKFDLNACFFPTAAGWQWQIKTNLSGIEWGLIHDGTAQIVADSSDGLIECSHLQGTLAIGQAQLQLKGVELRRLEDRWVFDLRAQHRFWDLIRLKGTVEKKEDSFDVIFDREKSHYLNIPVDVHACKLAMNGSIQSLKLSTSFSWDHLLTASILQEVHPSIRSLLRAPIHGSGRLEIDLAQDHPSSIQLLGEEIKWKGKDSSFSLLAHQQSTGWTIDRFQVGPYIASFQIASEEKRFKLSNGSIQWCDGNFAALSGFLSLSKCELNIDSLHSDLHQIIASFISPTLEGIVDGKGYLSMDWNDALVPEIDLDLKVSGIKSGCFCIDNEGPIQIHFSKKDGLYLRGLNIQVHKPDVDCCVHSQIDWMQFDFERRHWVLHHCQLNLPAGSLSLFAQKMIDRHSLRFLMQALDSTHNLELIADIDCAYDFSTFVCSMKEGFIPFLGAVCHIQNLNLEMKNDGMTASMSAVHQEHSLNINVVAALEPVVSGRVFLQDEEIKQERPLTIDWMIDSKGGVTLQSIEGICGGIEASFHAQQEGSLIGSARFQFGSATEILPLKLGKILKQLRLGKGYELKGSLFYDPLLLSNLSFKGLLSGKQCELLGYQVRTLLSQIEANSSEVRLFEIKASDAAGILKIDEIKVAKSDGIWQLSIPQLQLYEFRPSLLQKEGCEVGVVGPLVIREMKVHDVKGKIEDPFSWSAQGELNFINSFKREHSVFDLPSDLFGRIIGLDQELLIPVTGRLKFQLRENRICLTDLEDAYSEGKRSKFFLVKEGLSPTVDLDGNLHIFITMKQYVLFKLTENFLLTIDGTIQTPSFHLQKKSKLLGLGVL